jgi:EAL domain-containing protein (putative c-di-GMP-specific phosphodiesterase class I)
LERVGSSAPEGSAKGLSRKLGSGRIDQEVVRAIVSLAGSVGTSTIAEVVGDQPTLDLLSAYGVDYAQGFT